MNLQELIDSNNEIIIKKGIYETSPLFIPSNKKIIFEDGVIIKPVLSDDYELIDTRVAGINMKWYPAIINIINAKNVKILGNVLIDGMGEYFWEKYWGKDKLGGMRKEYDQKGLRWACDYDCKRLRTILIQHSENIEIQDATLYRSGFWNLHILYSHDILIKNVKIKTVDIESPSTDGIDIDSSYNVCVDSCKVDCFDDSICIKSGRDFDGIKTNIPSHDIEIKNCILNKGFGITIGSEVSGGIYNVSIHDNKFYNTDCGFRIKSSLKRKGYIKDINIYNLEMVNVKYVFNIMMGWNELYNKIEIPAGIDIRPEWDNIIKEVDGNISNTIVDNIKIKNINSTISNDYKGISRVFNIVGFENPIIKNIEFDNLNIKAFEYGIIKNCDYVINNSNLLYDVVLDEKNNEFDNR